MKKLATLLLAAGLLVGAATQAVAVDLKAKGYWSYSFEYGGNNKFVNRETGKRNDDEFSAGARIRLQLDAVASKALSGTVYFEIGDIYYGNADTGGALGTDGVKVEVKRAFLDWTVPNTDLSFRMGIQGMKLPLFASPGNFVLDDDAAGITASYKFNDNIALTAMWARLLNDNDWNGKNSAPTQDIHLGKFDNKDLSADNLDFYALMLPMNFDGFKATPWLGFSYIGDHVGRLPSDDYNDGFVSTSRKKLNEGMGVYTAESKSPTILEYQGGPTTVWWAGISAALSRFDPFNFKLDFIYGNKTGNGSSGYSSGNKAATPYNYTNDGGAPKATARKLDSERYDRQGWYLSALAEYKMDYFTPGVFFL